MVGSGEQLERPTVIKCWYSRAHAFGHYLGLWLLDPGPYFYNFYRLVAHTLTLIKRRYLSGVILIESLSAHVRGKYESYSFFAKSWGLPGL